MDIKSEIRSYLKLMGDHKALRRAPITKRFEIAGVKAASLLFLTRGIIFGISKLALGAGYNLTEASVRNFQNYPGGPMMQQAIQTVNLPVMGTVMATSLSAVALLMNSKYIKNEPRFRVFTYLQPSQKTLIQYKRTLSESKVKSRIKNFFKPRKKEESLQELMAYSPKVMKENEIPKIRLKSKKTDLITTSVSRQKSIIKSNTKSFRI